MSARSWFGVAALLFLACAHGQEFKCPDTSLSEEELTAIVTAQRARQPQLPPAYPQFRVRVEKVRCLYMYFEYALPEVRGKYQVFTIDPYGEVIDFSQSDRY